MAELLILGGTAWLGRVLASAAVVGGDMVTCLARGESGAAPEGVEWIRADRRDPAAYAALSGRSFDQVVEISWQPGWVRAALRAVGDRAGHWTLVSSISVYDDQAAADADESAPVATPLTGDDASIEQYGEGKSACEAAVVDAVGDRAVLARAGLIGGPGDGSQRTTYWPGRCAAAGAGPMLVPDVPDAPVQIVDVRDLARFVLTVGRDGRVGPVNAVGGRQRFADVLSAAASAADAAPEFVAAPPDWLVARQVGYWSGPRSLPLWLPAADAVGFGTRADARALDWGLRRRPLEETFADSVPEERALDPDAVRRSGLRRSDELVLIEDLRTAVVPAGA